MTESTAFAPLARRLDLWVVLLAIVIRGVAMYAQFGDLAADPDGYRGIANLVIETGEYRRKLDNHTPILTAYRPPLYPLLLAVVGGGNDVTDGAVAGLHLLLGVLTVWLTYRLGLLWLADRTPRGRGELWSLLGALLVALDPILLRQASLVMTETLATLLAVVCLLALTWHGTHRQGLSAAAVGAALGLACLCRPTFLPWLGLIVVVMLWEVLRHSRTVNEQGGPRWAHVAELVFVAVLVLLPWTLRNWYQLGAPIVTTTHGGYTLLLGNNPEFYDHLRAGKEGGLWDAEASQMNTAYSFCFMFSMDFNGKNERWIDRVANEWARESIAEQPGMFMYASLVRVSWFWQLMPHRISQSESTRMFLARLAVGVWYGGLFAAAIVGMLTLRGQLLHSPWLWGLLLALSLTALHSVYWSNMRMRAPLTPIVCILATVGLRAYPKTLNQE